MSPKRAFDFHAAAGRYHAAASGDPYPRLRAWEFLWDWVQSHQTWKSLASRRSRQETALHLGLYLAQWGMFRGSSKLLQVNLDFFEALTVHLFGGDGIRREFWELQLKDFGPGDQAAKACRVFDQGAERFWTFEAKRVSWTPTLLSKILLGVWGQMPAYDQYFNGGWSRFASTRADLHLPGRLWVDSPSLQSLARARAACGWKLGGYRTFHGRRPYPPGKVIDMAFFQAGYEG